MGVARGDRAVDVAHAFIHEDLLGAEVLHHRAVGMPQPVGREALGDREPAGVGPSSSASASGRDSGPRLAEYRDRAGLLRCLLGVPAGGRRGEQPRGKAVSAPVSCVLRHGAAAYEPELRDGEFDAYAGVLAYAVGVVEDVRDRACGDFGTASDVDELRALVASCARLALASEDVRPAMTGAGYRLRTGDVVEDQGRQPVRRVDVAVAVVLGRAADQFSGVQFVQLPLDAKGGGSDELRFQADDFAPPLAGVALEDGGDELVVAAGEQGRPLSGKQDAERVGDDLLRAAVAGAARRACPVRAAWPPGST